MFFGLARDDWKITGAKKKQFTLPDEGLLQRHAEAIRELQAKAAAEKLNSSNATPVSSSNPSNKEN
jgi:hypothetical protein